METTKNETLYVTEPLARPELAKLKRMVLGYGNFKKTALRLDMPITTLRDVINKGYAEPGTIDKIRQALNAEPTLK